METGLMLGKMDYCHSYRLKKRKGGDGGGLPIQRKPPQEFLQ